MKKMVRLAVRSITMKTERILKPAVLQRDPLLFTALLASAGGGAIYVFTLPALWRM